MRHAHSIFDLQQCRQRLLEVKMSHLVEIGFFPHIVLVVEDFAERLKDTRLVERAPIDFTNHVGRAVNEPEAPPVQVVEQPSRARTP